MPLALTRTAIVFLSCLACTAIYPQSAKAQSRSHGTIAVTVSDDAAENLDDLGDVDLGDDLDDDLEDFDLDDLLDADLSQLGQTDVVVPAFDEEVTTVSRQASTVGRSPAAVYVISNEMIRRSGARSIPEALRLAPGVHVARIDSNKWSISIRGFNQRFANKLLVQIDGRTVYTPLFAGVFWDVQDTLLEDVDRIEIIRGPGATVWGANAVNGIINIITKNSADTQGVYANAGVGNFRGYAGGRIGGQSESGNVTWRAYGKWFERQEGRAVGFPAADDWRMNRGGFRMDWRNTHCDTLTFQGDVYEGTEGAYSLLPLPVAPFQTSLAADTYVAGGNALFRWSRQLNDTDGWSVKMFYDRTEREFGSFREDRDTFDFDFQHQLKRGHHAWIWGAGYRNTRDRIRNQPFFIEYPNTRRADDILSGFLQDQMTLREERLFLTLGSKFSWNDYTNFEYQPTVRLLYTPSNRESWWFAVSRAVRTPSRAEHDVVVTQLPQTTPFNPTFPRLTGNRSFESEQLLAWEMGVRSAPTDQFYWDFAVFYNHYEDLMALTPTGFSIDGGLGVGFLPLAFTNGADADSYGFELASTYKVRDDWKLRGGYSFIKADLNASATAIPGEDLFEDPTNIAFVHSSWDIGCYWQFDLIGRYVDNLPADKNVPAYLEMDSRIAWLPNDVVELAVIGRNLLDSSHPEEENDSVTGSFSPEVRREVFFNAALRY